MESKFVFLGTGSSVGVPLIGCHCEVCQSLNPKNRRMRSGALLQVGDKQLLIDAGPDLRQQVLFHKIDTIDGFVLTHAHYDHIAGFDDLKVYKKGDLKVPCLMSEETFKELVIRYHYLIRPTEEDKHNSPFFTWHFVQEDFGKVVFEEVPLGYVSYTQSKVKVLGLRIGNLAYISDIKEYEEEIFKSLQGVEILIVGALREDGSQMHFSIPEALAFSKKVGAKTTYLTHICHEVDHEKTQATLPSGVFLAYDGLSFSFHMDHT